MNSFRKGMTLPVAILLITLLLGGGLGIFFWDGEEEGEVTESSLLTALENAREKLRGERNKLSNMRRGLSGGGFSFRDRLSNAYLNLRAALGGSDIIFDLATPQFPRLTFSSTAVSATAENRIIGRRAVVNQLLADWENRANIALSGNVTQETINELIQDVVVIQDYAEELLALAQSLTPENSDLSQETIDEYIESIENTLAEIEDILDELASTSPTGTVTPDDIAEQEQAVADAEQELEEAEEAWNNYQEEHLVVPDDYVPYQNVNLPGNPWATPDFPYEPLIPVEGNPRPVEFENQF